MTVVLALAILAIGTSVALLVIALRRARSQALRDQGELTAGARRFAALFASSPVAMSLSRLETQITVETNAAYQRLFGVTAAQIHNCRPSAAGIVFEPGFRERIFEQLAECKWVRDEASTVQTRDGKREVRIWSQVIDVDGVPHVLSTFVDETARHYAENRVRSQESMFREIAERLDEIIWVLSPTADRVHYMSPSYERVFGRCLANLDKNPLEWMQSVHRDDRDAVSALFGNVSERGEISFRIARDGKIRHMRAKFVPVRDESGHVIRVAGVTRDVTDQLQLEEQVRQAQKLESLGLLAGGVAHDFNNILAVIGANTSILGENASDEQREIVDDVAQAVSRGSSMTRQLLAFSRRQDVAPEVVDVNRVVDETRKMLRRMVGEDITFAISLDPELRSVHIDPNSLVQVLMNLAVNARDAMPTGGGLWLTTRNRHGTNGDEVLVEVKDSGCGMSAEVRSRIFEPFFTTKEAGKGTGLGLSVVHGIVRQAGGRIELDSEEGRGTTFRIYFPAVPRADKPSHADEQARASRGSEKLLMVDDDIFVRAAAARALRARGYHVLEASDGESALELIQREGATITLLVTDVVMPGMDGRQLAELACNQVPNLRVLYTTGYADDAVLRHGVQRTKVALIEKPFGTHQLAGRIRSLIDQREAS